MNEHLRRLLLASLEHQMPLGPFGDYHQRHLAERAWIDSLTAEDVLLLLGWVAEPSRPPEWAGLHESWIATLVAQLGEYAGQAGARLGDPRIRQRLAELLAIHACRSTALRGLEALGDPAGFEAALSCLGDAEARFDLSITLTTLATPEQIGALAGFLNDPNRDPAERTSVHHTLREFRSERWADYQALEASYPGE